MVRIFVASLLLLTTVACNGPGTETPAGVRLTVIDCGYLRFEDVTAFGLTNAETTVREMFVPCYLVQHPGGNLLWDAGLDPDLVGQGEVVLQPGAFMSYEVSIIDQLNEIGLAPADIDVIAISHMHFDHVGAGKLFPDATLLLQQAEYSAAFDNPGSNPVYAYETYSTLADNPRRLIEGDHDVFGDGSVQLISSPGHTAGHQVLLVRLANTGAILLSADLYHFEESPEMRRVPVFNHNAAQTIAAMERIENIVEVENAQFWIGHQMKLARSLNLAPAFYD